MIPNLGEKARSVQSVQCKEVTITIILQWIKGEQKLNSTNKPKFAPAREVVDTGHTAWV